MGRSGDGKRNILWGWPYRISQQKENARKVLKKANMPYAFFEDNEFSQARKCLKARIERRKRAKARETNQTHVKRGKHYEKYLH